MSFLLMAKAIKADIPDCYAKWLFVVLCDHANEDTHLCWPSISLLSKRTAMHRTTVFNKLDYLEQNGLLIKESGSRTLSNRYVVFPDEVVVSDDYVVAESDTNLSITSKSNNTKRVVPDNWQPTAELIASIDTKAKENLDHDHETARFCDHHISKGNKFIDINRAYRLWCRNSINYGTAKTLSGKAIGDKQSNRSRQQVSYFSRINNRLQGNRTD